MCNLDFPPWVRGHPRIDSLLLLQVVEGDQNRTRAHQRRKTGDLGGLPICSLVPSWWWFWLIVNSPTEPKSRTLSLRKGPLCGRGNNRPLQRNRKGIRFLMSLAKIKSNMNLLVSSNPRFCVKNGRKTMMMMMISSPRENIGRGG